MATSSKVQALVIYARSGVQTVRLLLSARAARMDTFTIPTNVPYVRQNAVIAHQHQVVPAARTVTITNLQTVSNAQITA